MKLKVYWKNIFPVRSLCSVLVILIIIAFIIAIATAIHNHKKSQSRSKHHPDPSSPVMSPSSSFLDSLLQSNAVNQKSKGFFIMGDSSVDCGLNTLFYPVLRRNLSLFPCSNGDDSSLIPYFLAKKMNIPAIPTFYEQNGTIEGIVNGLNFGAAQSTILSPANGLNFQTLHQQLRQAFETIQLLHLQLGELEAQNFIRSSVFYLSIGKDDYINFFFENASFPSEYNGNTELFPRLLVDEMMNALRGLYNEGVRKVVVMGVYPLGCAPRAVVDWYFLTGRNRRRMRVCVSEINEVITQHNQLLNDGIIDLNMELSDAQFVFCDVYQAYIQIMSTPQTYGFEDVRGACCGRGWHGAAEGCQNIENACNQTSTHMWWDFYNPTHAVNSLLADSAWSGQPLGDICHPFSIQGLVMKL
ncbi:unnamed protein product [Amaranthus hypochondriacus]